MFRLHLARKIGENTGIDRHEYHDHKLASEDNNDRSEIERTQSRGKVSRYSLAQRVYDITDDPDTDGTPDKHRYP